MTAHERDVKFNVSEEGPAEMHLRRAILVYGGKGGGQFATVHDIATAPGGGATILPGRPMTAFAVQRLARKLTKRREGGFIPEKLIFQDADTIAWWVPPSRRRVWFRCPEGQLIAGERSEVVSHPGLVFSVATARKWFVWAIKGTARPTDSTKLFRAPYFNVWESGQVCVGNVDLPERASAEKLDEWTNAFFESWFTHPNVHAELVRYRGGAYRFWRDMLDGKHAEFPERTLVDLGRTLGEALQSRNAKHDD